MYTIISRVNVHVQSYNIYNQTNGNNNEFVQKEKKKLKHKG